MKPMSVQGKFRVLHEEKPAPGRQEERRIEELLADDGDDTILDPRIVTGVPSSNQKRPEVRLPTNELDSVREPEPWIEDATYRPELGQGIAQVKQVLIQMPANQRSAREPVRTERKQPPKAERAAAPILVLGTRPRTVPHRAPEPAAKVAEPMAESGAPRFLTKHARVLILGAVCAAALLAAAMGGRLLQPRRQVAAPPPAPALLKPSALVRVQSTAPQLPESTFGQPQAQVDLMLKRAIADYGQRNFSAARGGLSAYDKILPNRATQTAMQILNRLLGDVP